MHNPKTELEELKKGVQYEHYINTEFSLIPTKKVVSKSQLEDFTSTDADRLRINLTKNNLKEIVEGPSLINEIVKYLKDEDELISFNKYFPVLKQSLAGFAKLKSLKQFEENYDLFRTQGIGKELLPSTDVKVLTDSANLEIPRPYTQAELEGLPIAELDNVFVKYLELYERRPFDDIDSIRIITSKGKEKIQTIKTKTPIITFDRAKDTTTYEQSNNFKIRYILNKLYPGLLRKDYKVKWNGIPIYKPTFADFETETDIKSVDNKETNTRALMPGIAMLTNVQGSGLTLLDRLSNPRSKLKKKRLGNMRFR